MRSATRWGRCPPATTFSYGQRNECADLSELLRFLNTTLSHLTADIANSLLLGYNRFAASSGRSMVSAVSEVSGLTLIIPGTRSGWRHFPHMYFKRILNHRRRYPLLSAPSVSDTFPYNINKKQDVKVLVLCQSFSILLLYPGRGCRRSLLIPDAFWVTRR